MRFKTGPDTVMIAITFADDSIGVMQFVVTEFDQNGAPRWARAATKENVDAEIARSSFDAEKLPIKGWRFIFPEDLPTHRAYRPAWQDDGAKITHNMDRAREHHRKVIRHMRGPKLQELDGKWMRAFATGDTASAKTIEAKRQALRDAPADPRIDQAQTVEDLLKLTDKT